MAPSEFYFFHQTDYAKGFGGKFGVQSDRVDKTAHTYEEEPERVGTNYEKYRPEGKCKVPSIKL